MSSSFESLCGQLLDDGQRTYQRRLLVLAGARDWGRQQADVLLNVMRQRQPSLVPCWVADKGSGAEGERVIPANKHQLLLGGEHQVLLFDMYCGLNANGLGAASGIVMGGGVLVLLTPPLDQWSDFADPEYQRLAVWSMNAERMSGNFLSWVSGQIREDANLMLVEEGEPCPVLQSDERPIQFSIKPSGDCATEDQQAAVDAIRQVALGHRRRPLVITADRGRGKSSALGIAAISLLRAGKQRILVTAPNLAATDALFRQAGNLAESAEINEGRVVLGSAVIEFIAPDELLIKRPDCDLLLVDEAAAIPTPLLEGMLERYARIVYATTIHGYEGSGRGFALRFQSLLQKNTPHWKHLKLSTPIRWAEQDPVERWCFNTLLLDAECPLVDGFEDSLPCSTGNLQLHWIEQQTLLQQPELLSQLFGLLVMAHYRTSPDDLRHLLDGPNLSILVLMREQQLVGVMLLAAEGGFDAALSQSIWLGQRRPRGHLLPQSLAAHGGLLQAPEKRCLRIMRIAVHPQLQGKGYGLQLVREAERVALGKGFDFIGASFGATPILLKFWRRAGLLPVRLGVSREASSGSYSAMVLKALNLGGEQLLALARQRFAAHFPHQLSEIYAFLDAPLVSCLLAYSAEGLSIPDTQKQQKQKQKQDWLDLISFADGNRVYETCAPVLFQALSKWLQDEELEWLTADERALLVGKVLQQRPWSALADELRMAGRKPILKKLRHLYARQLDRLLPEELSDWRRTLHDSNVNA